MRTPAFTMLSASKVLTLAACLTGCSQQAPQESDDATQRQTAVFARDEAARPEAGSPTLFMSLSPKVTGVDFVNPIDESHPLRCLYATAQMCGGVAIGDVNGDGLSDIYLTSGPRDNRLYLQTGDLRFEDVTARAGVAAPGTWSTGASLADVDADGDLDLYVCNYDSPNLLYVNQGDGTFVDEAKARGVDFVDASHMAAFCDYDADGDLDFYLMTYRYTHPAGSPPNVARVSADNKIVVRPEYEKYFKVAKVIHKGGGRVDVKYDIASRPDRLLRNNGAGRFEEVAVEAGVADSGCGLSVTWWDYNGDLRPDLYVGNDFRDPDHLYRNNGDGTFTDVIGQMVPHTTWFSMGADFADLNDTGRFDFLIADMSPTTHFKQKANMGVMNEQAEFLTTANPRQYMRNTLYVNAGVDRFMEGAYLAGLANSDWTWTVKLADLDNDGRVDVYLTNGMSRNFNRSDTPKNHHLTRSQTEWQRWHNTPKLLERNLAFRNNSDLHFAEVGKDWGLDHEGISFAAAHADLDNDGDLDLVVTNLDEPVGIYRNDTTRRGVSVRLVGKRSNRWGLGARVTLQTGAGRQVRMLSPVRGYLCSNDPRVHFGLGEAEQIDRLTVEWPSGHVQILNDPKAETVITVEEPDGASPPPALVEPEPTMFVATNILGKIAHRETPYDDFKRQPLLPNKLSQLGPGMAWGDVDGDGDDDLFVSGAVAQAGQLYRNEGGRFVPLPCAALLNDRMCEDMGAVLFDVDGDGDQDLYVVSGGVEYEADDNRLSDRLYLNDGNARFTLAPAGTLPKARDSGGVVTTADFDRDGDLDLFVGGRVIPGEYPLAPRSRLLRNEGGKFIDATEQLAPRLGKTGMVTGAVWSDADGDGWLDLLVTHEWGPVKLFHNAEGRLIDRTAEVGLSQRSGWWNGIAARDVDGDGDIDYVVTNFGLNTKYHASNLKPTQLYYGDFEGTGRMRLVETEYENETLFPVRGRSCSSNAMPFLRDKYSTFRDFALAPVKEIYTPACLANAQRFAANTLASGVLINDGGRRFDFRPLPRIAQISPGFGVVLTEVNGDHRPDIYMVQNFFSPQAETGQMGGGVSLLLRGGGDGTFQPVWPHKSGLVVPGDAMSLAACDLDDDGRPDFVVGVNDGAVQAFRNRAAPDQRMSAVRLVGRPGNPTAVGARVVVELSDGSKQTAEVHSGGGYLSQGTSALFFGLGDSDRPRRVEVVWPDGTRASVTPRGSAAILTISHPKN